jgi:phosphate-selective porin OprO/OprP
MAATALGPVATVARGEEAAAEAASDAAREPAAGAADERRGSSEAAVPLDEEKERYLYLEAYWQRGLNYRVSQRLVSTHDYERRRRYGFAANDSLSGRVGFRIATDAAAYVEGGGLDDIDADIDLRRAFLYVSGDFFFLYPASFKIEMGSITSSFYIQSAWLRWRQLPYVGSFKIGQYDPPYGLEAFASSNDLTFMESASPSQAFAPGTKFGLQLANSAFDQRLTWALGWFADTQDNDVGDAGRSVARIIGRLTYLAVDRGEDDTAERRLLHLGLDMSLKYAKNRDVRYQSRPESFLAPVLIDTGNVAADAGFVFSGESAWVQGPLSLQGEATLSYSSGVPGTDPVLWGLYGYASYFLTGETRPYSRDSGVFGHLEPRRPLFLTDLKSSGWGAWEIGGRYSFVDLTAGDVRGGRMHGVTAGLNWYWSRYLRWQFNYQWMNVAGGLDDGRLHVFQMRLQLVV